MNKQKKFISVILVTAVTLAVVLLPLGINAIKSASLTKKSEYWQYDGATDSRITSEQVLSLYCNSQLDFGEYRELQISECGGKSTADLGVIFPRIFTSEHQLYKDVLSLTNENIVSIEGQSILTSSDSSPTVLNFIDISYTLNDYTVQLVYEQKTLTLLSFYCRCDGEKSVGLQAIADAFATYFKSLGLSENQYNAEINDTLQSVLIYIKR